ncbi:type II toxin-antitoxin system HicB family antitoxin [Arenimonas daejeonensis]|uniref:type II toxin-antitoxin system HicB family antitoxin n=1 Tax=Arenimonas daejeonensis TaxID=370777 RepID=UPI0011BE2EB2|nr:type II toxin-antitoxin system HicB family antitoxin [Arenimonas daejeonensis]
MRYAIVIEKTENNFGAWVPDLPGCVATGKTIDVVEKRIREAIEMHLAGMREDGDPIPPPTAQVNYVDVAA